MSLRTELLAALEWADEAEHEPELGDGMLQPDIRYGGPQQQ